MDMIGKTKKQLLNRSKVIGFKKIEENMARDKRNDLALQSMNWKVLHFWEKTALHCSDYCVELIKYEIKTRP